MQNVDHTCKVNNCLPYETDLGVDNNNGLVAYMLVIMGQQSLCLTLVEHKKQKL